MQLLLEMSISTLFFYGLFATLYEGKNNHQFNRFYLLVSLLFSIVIPLVGIPVFPQYELAQIVVERPVFTGNIVEGSSYVLTWENAFFLLWGSGVILNFSLLFKSVFTLKRIVKSSEVEVEKDHTKVFTNDRMAVSSFLHYLFIPKEQKQTISDYEIKHELTHIHQNHSFDVLFIESIKAFFWFNPLLYLYKKRLVEIHEFLADQNTSNELGKEDYEAFLIRQITAGQQPKLVHNFYSLFKKRLVMMQSNVSMKYWQYGAVLPVFLLCFMIFSCNTYTVKNTKYPPMPPELVGEMVDTVFTFDPETKTETIRYVKKGSEGFKGEVTSIQSQSTRTGIDTLIIFDPTDLIETVIVVNHDTGERDTIQ